MSVDAAPSDVRSRSSRAAYSVKIADDAEAQSRAMTGWDHVYHQVDRKPFSGSVSELLIGQLQVAVEEINNSFAYRGGIRRGFVNFTSTVPTPGNLVCGGRSLLSDAIVRFPRDYTHSAFGNGPVKFFSISIEEDALKESMAPLLGGQVPASMLDSTLCIVDHHLVTDFRQCVLGVLEECATTPQLVADERWCESARQRVLQMLFDVLVTGSATPQRLPPPSTRAYIVDKAVEYMRGHLEDPPVMRQVCKAVRVCPRTLRYSFEDIVGASPNRFLLALRLQQVRRDLLETGPGASIQLIAQRYGFWHMSRFARFYHQAFGELPSATCRRAEPATLHTRRGRGVATSASKLN